DADLEIIPILNKIDLPGAEPERRRKEVADLLGIDEESILLVSAKEGIGIGELLEEVVRKVPPPRGDENAPLRALIYDSYYDKYRGAVPSVRVVDGVIKKGTHITFGASESVYEVDEVGYNQLRQVPTEQLGSGEVGFRAGFLGLLHMEIVQERLNREFDLELVTTVPSVEYKVYKSDGTMTLVENPSLMPNAQMLDFIEEPYVMARIMVPAEYIGAIMTLGTERRGVYKNMTYLDTQRVELDWEFPLAEIILDFFDKLKTVSRGYASLDYEMLEYRRSELVKLDMVINGDPVDAFSVIIHEDKA